MNGARVATDGLGDTLPVLVVGCAVLAALLAAATGRFWLAGLGMPAAAYVALVSWAAWTVSITATLDGPVQMLALICGFALPFSLGGAAIGAVAHRFFAGRSGRS